MKYSNITKGTFLTRKNRFIAEVMLENGNTESVHIKNTGRCKELFVYGAEVYLFKSENHKRKTMYDLIAVNKDGNNLINVDSFAPNIVAEEWLKTSNIFSEKAFFRREAVYGNSRFDIYVKDGDRSCYIEVKGVTLEQRGVVSFPDAPTERGIKHLNELIHAAQNGFEAWMIFVVQMKSVKYFTPNKETHPKFAATLEDAIKKGVKVVAIDCVVTDDTIAADGTVQVVLSDPN